MIDDICEIFCTATFFRCLYLRRFLRYSRRSNSVDECFSLIGRLKEPPTPPPIDDAMLRYYAYSHASQNACITYQREDLLPFITPFIILMILASAFHALLRIDFSLLYFAFALQLLFLYYIDIDIYIAAATYISQISSRHSLLRQRTSRRYAAWGVFRSRQVDGIWALWLIFIRLYYGLFTGLTFIVLIAD